jgi:hypothetical protein
MVISQEVEDMCQRLRRRQLEGSLPCAKATAELLRTLVTSRRHPDAQALLDDVKSTGIKIQEAKPLGTLYGLALVIPLSESICKIAFDDNKPIGNVDLTKLNYLYSLLSDLKAWFLLC